MVLCTLFVIIQKWKRCAWCNPKELPLGVSILTPWSRSDDQQTQNDGLRCLKIFAAVIFRTSPITRERDSRVAGDRKRQILEVILQGDMDISLAKRGDFRYLPYADNS
jgi:hypothetical protein